MLIWIIPQLRGYDHITHSAPAWPQQTINLNYVYLGTTFNYNGTFHKAKAKQALQAKKATFSLIRRTKQLNLTFEVSIELFERLIIPILLYGSEIWGYECPKQLQIMFNNAMRMYLRLHRTTPMCMINGKLGLKEI